MTFREPEYHDEFSFQLQKGTVSSKIYTVRQGILEDCTAPMHIFMALLLTTNSIYNKSWPMYTYSNVDLPWMTVAGEKHSTLQKRKVHPLISIFYGH